MNAKHACSLFAMTAGRDKDVSKAKRYNRLSLIMYSHLTVSLLNGTRRHNFHTNKSKEKTPLKTRGSDWTRRPL